MNPQEFVPPPVQDLIRGSAPRDLVIGVLTFNNRATIGELTATLLSGARQHCSDHSLLLIGCDGGSQDGTPEAMTQAAAGADGLWQIRHLLPPAYSKVFSESGVPGREHAVRLILAIAEQVNARACVLIDGNLRSVTPEWVALLAQPVLEKGYDCVCPVYRRGKYEGTLTNTILYPLTRALYGKRVRFQHGGGFGVSGKFAKFCLLQPAWEQDIVRYGIDGWLPTVAVAEGFEVCQAFLGSRLSDSKVGAPNLAGMLAQSVGGAFSLMEQYHAVWEVKRGSAPVAWFGPAYEAGRDTGVVNIERMIRGFQQGLRDLLPVWQLIMSPETLEQVMALEVLEAGEFRFPPDLWVQTVYDFALAYHDRVVHRGHLLKALTPLYLGFTAAMILKTRDQGGESMERAIEELCERYEALKPYVVQQWRWQNE